MNLSSENNQKFRWSVANKLEINANADEVWKTISTAGNLANCHPFCRKNPVKQWGGVGSQDSIFYYSGLVLYRNFTHWIDGVGYDLEIAERKGNNMSRVSWRIFPKGDKSELLMAIQPYHLQDMLLIPRWFAHYSYLRPTVKKYIISVLKGFDWYISTGKPVDRNQFGSHKWFSPN